MHAPKAAHDKALWKISPKSRIVAYCFAWAGCIPYYLYNLHLFSKSDYKTILVPNVGVRIIVN
jgi:hypothetical protein